MRILKIVLIIFILLSASWYGLIMLASESGEVVILSTLDESGETRTTRLWIVDYEHSQYLRSGNPKSGWFQRIQQSTSVSLERKENRKPYTAELAANLRIPINKLMADKYGWAESFIDFFLSRDDAIPVRLVPFNRHSEQKNQQED